jgi:hypothetical protein
MASQARRPQLTSSLLEKSNNIWLNYKKKRAMKIQLFIKTFNEQFEVFHGLYVVLQ